MSNTSYYHTMKNCPEHKEEFLEEISLLIKTPNQKEGMVHPFFQYCKKDKTFYDGNQKVSMKEAALKYMERNYPNENYSLDNLEVITEKDYIKEVLKKRKRA